LHFLEVSADPLQKRDINMESFMLKKLLAFALLTGSISGFAQTTETAGKTEGTFPEVRQIEQKEDYKLHMGLSGGIHVPEGNAGILRIRY
jgi:hypothetical protein